MNIDFKDKKTLGLIIAAGTLVMITAVIIAVLVLFPPKKIEIPDFATKTKIEVDTWIVENDLSEDQVLFSYEYNESITKDVVITQSILAGESLKKDDVLTLTLSNGSDPELILTLPDFTGQKHDEIEAWFLENKFSDVSYEYIPDPKIKKDLFIKTNITEKDVRRNTPILVSISVGTESVGIEIDMPDFKDYTKANIQAWGKTNNITISFKEEASEKIAAGKLISQDPKAGAKIKTGSKAKVSLSSGKGATAIKFDGKKKADVDAWAKENNIKVTYQDTYDNKVANGIVISNTPNTGTIKTGSTMTVKISVGKPSVDNYTNKSKDSFVAHIDALNKKEAKLKYTITEVESDKALGTIIKQTINNKVVTASTTVDTGTTIIIEVAKVKSVNVASKAGSSFDDFKKYVEGLGMKVGSKTDRYNDTYNSGIIVSNDTGNKMPNTSINYTQSLGKWSPAKTDFESITKDAAQKKINDANGLGAGWNITFSAPEEKAGVPAGNTFECSVSGKTAACKVSKGSPATVESKSNISEADFIKYIKDLGLVPKLIAKEFNVIVKGNIIRNESGPFWPGSTVDYVLSDGPDPAEETATFPNYSLPTLNGASLDATKNNVRNALTPFTNITFEIESIALDNPLPNFSIASVSIAPNTENVKLNAPVVVKIYVKE